MATYPNFVPGQIDPVSTFDTFHLDLETGVRTLVSWTEQPLQASGEPRSARLVDGFEGVEAAKRVKDVTEIEVSVAPGTRVRPLPDDGTYLGFVFSRASGPERVEASLREAVAHLRPVIRRTDAGSATKPAASVEPTDPRPTEQEAP